MRQVVTSYSSGRVPYPHLYFTLTHLRILRHSERLTMTNEKTEFQKFLDEWPGGLEEVEASIAGHKRIIAAKDREIEGLRAELAQRGKVEPVAPLLAFIEKHGSVGFERYRKGVGGAIRWSIEIGFDDKTFHADSLENVINAALGNSQPAPGAVPVVQAVEPTYSSTQATNCAQCGEHKHTPLRIDRMGGYVCLTCIDTWLESLLGKWDPDGEPQAEKAPSHEGAPLSTDDLRKLASEKPDPMAPHLLDSMRRALRWAADVIDAAEVVIQEKAPSPTRTIKDYLTVDVEAPSVRAVASMRLVPLEPTEAMIQAGRDCQDYDPRDETDTECLHLYRAMIQAAPQHPSVPDGWQPIETAPKDGTQIMLTNGEIVAQGWWEHEDPYIREKRDTEGNYIDQDEHDGFDDWLDCQGGMNPSPTYWQPLPAAPKAVEP